MGYESRVLVANVHRIKGVEPIAEIIADVKMSKMGYAFPRLFNKPIDFKVYLGNEEVTEDCYGEKLKEGNIKEIIKWLKNAIKTDNYRRMPVLLKLLQAFDSEYWEELHIIHYGY